MNVCCSHICIIFLCNIYYVHIYLYGDVLYNKIKNVCTHATACMPIVHIKDKNHNGDI